MEQRQNLPTIYEGTEESLSIGPVFQAEAPPAPDNPPLPALDENFFVDEECPACRDDDEEVSTVPSVPDLEHPASRHNYNLWRNWRLWSLVVLVLMGVVSSYMGAQTKRNDNSTTTDNVGYPRNNNQDAPTTTTQPTSAPTLEPTQTILSNGTNEDHLVPSVVCPSRPLNGTLEQWGNYPMPATTYYWQTSDIFLADHCQTRSATVLNVYCPERLEWDSSAYNHTMDCHVVNEAHVWCRLDQDLYHENVPHASHTTHRFAVTCFGEQRSLQVTMERQQITCQGRTADRVGVEVQVHVACANENDIGDGEEELLPLPVLCAAVNQSALPNDTTTFESFCNDVPTERECEDEVCHYQVQMDVLVEEPQNCTPGIVETNLTTASPCDWNWQCQSNVCLHGVCWEGRVCEGDPCEVDSHCQESLQCEAGACVDASSSSQEVGLKVDRGGIFKPSRQPPKDNNESGKPKDHHS